MNAVRDLPTPARIGIAAVVVLLVFGVLMMLVFGGSKTKVVKEQATRDEASLAVVRLKSEGINGTMVEDPGGMWTVTVPASREQDAYLALGVANKRDKLGPPKCGQPGTFDAPSAKKILEQCKKKAAIYQQVVATDGIDNAAVELTMYDADGEEGARATVMVVPEPGHEQNLEKIAPNLGSTVLNSLPGMREHQQVLINDNKGNRLFDSSNPVIDADGGCGSMIKPDISTSSCLIEKSYEKKFSEPLGRIVGEENVNVEVMATLNTAAVQRETLKYQSNKVMKTFTESKNAAGSGKNRTSNSQVSKTMSPDEVRETVERAPGTITKLNVTAVLTNATPAQQEQARLILNGMMARKADRVTVASVKQAATPTTAPAAEADTSASDASGAASPQVAAQQTMMRTVVLVAIALTLVMAAAVAMLWHRNSRLSRERQEFNSEFQNDMRHFNSTAERSPDELADEISAWLGQRPADNRAPR